MNNLVKTDEAGDKWLPISIDKLKPSLERTIVSRGSSGGYYDTPYALRSDIAYNLQYIEFLHKVLSDIKLTSLLENQTWKSIILRGSSVMEALLHYLLVNKKLVASNKKHVTFYAIIEQAKLHSILGPEFIYEKLDELRILRNKVHLKAKHATDTDWNSFDRNEVNLADEIIHTTFTGPILNLPTCYFQYLKDYYTTE